MSDNLPISEQYLRKAHVWADLEFAATMLEESKSAVLSQMILAHGDIPYNRAEMRVKASEPWKEYLGKMIEARKKANHAKVELEYLRMKFQEWNSAEANNRLQARL